MRVSWKHLLDLHLGFLATVPGTDQQRSQEWDLGLRGIPLFGRGHRARHHDKKARTVREQREVAMLPCVWISNEMKNYALEMPLEPGRNLRLETSLRLAMPGRRRPAGNEGSASFFLTRCFPRHVPGLDEEQQQHVVYYCTTRLLRDLLAA